MLSPSRHNLPKIVYSSLTERATAM